MEQTINWEPTKDEAAQFKAIVEQCLKTMQESNDRSVQTHAEIARLSAETRSTLTQIGKMLNVETTF